MYVTSVLLLVGALLAIASPVACSGHEAVHQKRAAPVVNIDTGTIIGSTDAIVDTFRGIPFARPPVGNLRLKPPQPVEGSLGTVNAVGTPRACPQMSFAQSPNISALANAALTQLQGKPLFQAATNSGEDCLTLNVQRPARANATSQLPVLVWIFGGGFEFGSTQSYDGSALIQQGLALDAPFLFVEMNYRASGFGFLAGKELQADGSTNLGLRDQRLALEWVQDNIAAFGGDPTKVTIWGESAGAVSVFDQTIIKPDSGLNTYKNGTLFRGAIMDSGSIAPADTVTGPKAQNVYNTVVVAAGCSSAADTLACLRSADYATFLYAINSVPGIFSYRSVDLAYLPRPDPVDDFFPVSPEIAVEQGRFAKVPVIIGDQEDEGTLFSLTQFNITTAEKLVQYLASYFPSNPDAVALTRGLVATYPDDLGVSGSPFRTGVLNNIYPEFKRLAAILGDLVFTLSRRIYLSHVTSQVPAWSYLSSYFYGTPILGTFHASDIPYAFGDLGPANVPTISIQKYYISFVNHLDPNALGTSVPLTEWPKWGESDRSLLNFQLLSNQIITDDFREASYEYLLNNTSGFRV